MKKRIIITGLVIALAFSFTACKETDVVGKVSKTSFKALVEKLPDNTYDDSEYNAWGLASPTGERFLWGKDFSAEGYPDVMIEVDAQPFIDAGLDITKFPEEMIAGDKIVYKSELSNDAFTYKGDPTPLSSFNQLVETNREAIGYHEALDHYGVALGDGNMFEWAKDMSTNDKDMVFVFDPKPFIDAGVDVNNVEGWVFAKVPVMDEDGNKIEVDKLLKPFSLD